MHSDPKADQALSEKLLSVNLSEKQLQRFWRKVNRGGPDDCWPWNARQNDLGYGNVFIAGKCRLSHRIAFCISKGSFLDRLKICHSCDNPPCCNPTHLWLGTDLLNAQDRDAKGRRIKWRTYRGGEHVKAKLTDKQAKQICNLYAFGEWLHREIAEMYGVSSTTIQRIVTKSRWKHLL
jgi:hypothetical protein